jgi:hypothetical protein
MDSTETKKTKFLSRKLLGFLPIKILFGALAGIFAGFLYYKFIGCSTGSCRITSNPWISMSFFGLFGIVFSSGK